MGGSKEMKQGLLKVAVLSSVPNLLQFMHAWICAPRVQSLLEYNSSHEYLQSPFK